MSLVVPATWLAVLSVCAPAVLAQSAAPARAAASAPAPAYRSAFEGYQRWADDKPTPWPQANATVRARGGWRAYAQEAAQPGAHAGHAVPSTGAPQ